MPCTPSLRRCLTVRLTLGVGIAAVVIGGTNILGGRGRYLGTLIGVVLIVLLNSVLSIMDMPEAGRQVIYGLVIILMLLVYGRGERVMS